MRKVSLILVVLLFVAPAWARVDIKCEQVGDTNEVIVSYRVTEDEPNKVRAFGLDITVDDGTITGYDDSVNDDYVIYPGSIVIDTSGPDPCVSDYGTPIGDPCDHLDTQPGLDSNGVTIEMGALWHKPVDSDQNAPPDQNDNDFHELLSFYTSGVDCSVTIVENEARGGVVMTDPTIDPDVNAPGCGIVMPQEDCFPITPNYAGQRADYDAYKLYNNNPSRVDCWCNNDLLSGNCINQPCVFQCDGDANGDTEGLFTKYRVYTNDLGLIITHWKKKITDPTIDPCADVGHDSEGLFTKFRVYTNDLGIVIDNWKKKDSDLPGNCPRPDGM